MKTEVWVSYNYGGWSLVFAKTFELPCAPFYGLTIEDNDGGVEIELNREDTSFSYNVRTGEFFANVHKRWVHPVEDEEIDDIILSYGNAGWEQKDQTNIADLKELMEREAKRIRQTNRGV